jgi:uncharacterized ion transporter superfamily protein YfcC
MSKLRFPHPLVLLLGCILLAAALTYLLPAGQYDRRDDPATGRRVVVAGTYHEVAPHHVNLFEAMVDVPRGMADAGAVIFFVFLVGGAFTVVDRTGALRGGVDAMIRRLEGRRAIVVPSICVVFALGGVLDNMREEIIALVPVVLLVTRRLGYGPVTACAMSIGSAIVGASFSPINPFQAGIAQKLAELPLLSGSLFRIAFLVPAVALWIAGTMRHAARTRTEPAAAEPAASARLGARHAVVLVLVLAAFAAFLYGVLALHWEFEQMAALFFIMGVAAGLIGGLRLGGTAEAFVEGFKFMTYAGLLIGFARAIYVVLDQGRIVDTIVKGLFDPIARLPVAVSAPGMMAVQTLIHFPVPSVSGHAVLTIPILVPLSDLLGLSRQITVLAYQYGAGLCEMITPTNGALMAILASAGVRFEAWMKFALPLYLALAALAIVALAAALAIGLT